MPARGAGDSPEQAQDHTQEFFARFLEHDYFDRADPEGGRFRSFLLSLSSFTCTTTSAVRVRKGAVEARSTCLLKSPAAAAVDLRERILASGRPADSKYPVLRWELAHALLALGTSIASKNRGQALTWLNKGADTCADLSK